ncbi:MAG: A/G-specific adenine glycosylase [Sphingomonadales bacterium]
MKPDPRDLLNWYDDHARRLPWRTPPKTGADSGRADPYRVWLSEVMLQQTTVAVVIPYFERFLDRWPTVDDLARAPLDAVLSEWAGLGYYARARNLHKCAGVVSRDLGGHFPDTEDGLRALPGVGTYTAAAIAAIAFDRPATVVDGNVERVMARLFAVTDPLPAAKPALKAHAGGLTPDVRPGDYAQAVMDLGATICTPRAPKCLVSVLACPWAKACAGRKSGIAPELPRRTPKAARPVRRGVAFWLQAPHPETGAPAVLLRRRDGRGLLGSMMEVPSRGWSDDDHGVLAGGAPLEQGVEWKTLDARVGHTFTHFHLELEVRVAIRDAAPDQSGGDWHPIDDLSGQALPSVMVKVARLVLDQ